MPVNFNSLDQHPIEVTRPFDLKSCSQALQNSAAQLRIQVNNCDLGRKPAPLGWQVVVSPTQEAADLANDEGWGVANRGQMSVLVTSNSIDLTDIADDSDFI
jgi:hypothetical protein